MITELEWDSKFFGRKIGRLTKIPSEKRFKRLIEKACEDGYTYLTCRFVLKKMSDVQILGRHNFYVTDIGVVWERKVSEISEPAVLVREATIKDIAMLKSMVRGLFSDSRFYNDPFFTYEEADKFYQAWIGNSLKDKAIKVFVAGESGFITCRILSKNKGDIPLVGVISQKQGKGIGSSLVYKALDWFKIMGVKTITVRTQATNTKAMNFYMGEGFKIKYTDVTMGLILTQTVLTKKMKIK